MARSFNGSTDYISMGTGGGVGATHAWSASAWLYPTSTNDSAIITKRDGFSGGNDQFFMGTGDSLLELSLTKDASFMNTTQTGTINQWNFYAFAGDSGGGVGCLNGNTSLTATGGSSLNFGSNWASGSGTGQALAIGVLQTEALDFATGRIADVALWNVKLTANELISLSRGVRPYLIRPANLAGYWPLDGLSSPEPDLSGNALNGTLHGTSAANGPPTTLWTPKPPLFAPYGTQTFLAAWALNRNTVAGGVAT